MLTIQRLVACLGIVFFAGCASTGDLTKTQIFDGSTRIGYSAAGDPVRHTDASSNVSWEDLVGP